MSQDRLDVPQIGLVAQHMSGHGMAKAVWSNPFVNLGSGGRSVHDFSYGS
jgi:hypothetical protein